VAKLDLKKLKKQLLKNQKAENAAKKEATIQQLNDNRDQDIFREAMSGVNPLSNKKSHVRAYHEGAKPVARQLQHNKEIKLNIHDPLSDELEVEEIDTEDILSY